MCNNELCLTTKRWPRYRQDLKMKFLFVLNFLWKFTQNQNVHISTSQFFCITELQTILLKLFLSWKKSTGEGFKRNSRKDEFFSYMKLFQGIYLVFYLQAFWKIQCYCQASSWFSALFQLSSTSEHPGRETGGAPKLKSRINSKGIAF